MEFGIKNSLATLALSALHLPPLSAGHGNYDECTKLGVNCPYHLMSLFYFEMSYEKLR